jgi:hypothetical protein
MANATEVTAQLRLLGDLRDMLERWLNLARPGQESVAQVQVLLLEIQRTRNQLLVDQVAAAGAAVAEHVKASEALLVASLDIVRTLFGPISPLHRLAADFMRRAETARGSAPSQPT